MLLTRLHRPQSSSQAYATITQLRRFNNKSQEEVNPIRRYVPKRNITGRDYAIYRNTLKLGKKSDRGWRWASLAEFSKGKQNNGVGKTDELSTRVEGDSVKKLEALVADEEAQETEAQKPAQHLSLFEKLFPEEAAKALQPVKTTKLRQAYLPREFEWAKSWPNSASLALSNVHSNFTPLKDPKSRSKPSQARAEPDPHMHKVNSATSVLVLSNASPSLASSDFLRLSPKGTHIEGWLSGILKIIPGRDPQTLKPLGHFFILFSSDAAARAYADNVIRLHRIARTYTPTGAESAIPPPRGYVRDGEDIHKLMSEFTLVPASMPSVNLRMLKRPFSPSVQKLIEDGGVPALVKRQEKCPNLVLLNFSNGGDYSFVSEFEVRRWLALDGRRRGLPWGLMSGEDEIVRLDGRDDEDNEEHAVGWKERERRAVKGRQRLPPRFVLSFAEAVEARRFVREWHKREFVVDDSGADDGEAPMIIDAELLW